MILFNAVLSKVPSIPMELENKLYVQATYSLKEYDAKLYNVMLSHLVAQMKEEKFDFEILTKVTIIFTEYGKIQVSLEENQLANYSRLILYPIKLWEDKDFNEIKKAQCFIEELCHHFWNEEDELKVNYPVFNILKRAFPILTDINQIYNMKLELK